MGSRRSVEIRVGLFVLISLVVVAGLIIRFGKHTRGLEGTYEITVVFPNVGGIVRDAKVLYAGIPVGRVREIRLVEADRLQVHVLLEVREDVVIRRDAQFVINQSGLLGDRYVDILPGTTSAERLQPGDVVMGHSSVDLTEAIRHVVDVLKAAAGTIERVDKAIKRIDETVLSPTTLGHVKGALANIDTATTNAVLMVGDLRELVSENRQAIHATLAGFQASATNLTSATMRLDEILRANQDEVAMTMSNLVASTERIEGLLARFERGEGTVGKLMTDPTLYDEVVRLVQNWRRFGLLYKEGTRDRQSRPAPAPGLEPRGGRVPVPARPATSESP
ncbi:MAG: MlaD family protein [Verrucomicrobiae bacterium]|nr:MlaD family protein [Verrucomicrobiae bacterium]MDW8344341.1 MlaD family protein [Verrucomicrobiae bacterium]